MNLARLAALLKDGASLHEAFFSLAGTVSRWREHGQPFSAFLVGRIRTNGRANLLAYEMPPPVFLGGRIARLLDPTPVVVPAGLAAEYHCEIGPYEGVLCVSDGIVQAGLGGTLDLGWTSEALEEFLNQWQLRNLPFDVKARAVMAQARSYDGALPGDDKTVMLLHARPGTVVRVLTGPPRDRSSDAAVCREFLDADGVKVVCGATTAEILSRESGQILEMEQDFGDGFTPPKSSMKGADLVSEGVVTLTQVLNLLESDADPSGDRSAAGELFRHLERADRVHFTVGGAVNPANGDVTFRKQGILTRATVVPLIAARLEDRGKLVTVERI
jgi:hypothetical protein